jgi:hypothetical protein
MINAAPRYFHLHLISDSTGETLTTIAKAATVQYSQIRAIEHVHPLVRTSRQLEHALREVDKSPGIVLYTLVSRKLGAVLEAKCKDLKVPCVAVLDPVLEIFQSYLGMTSKPTVGAQHALDSDYFKRIDALNFSMIHDDGVLPEDLEQADIVLVGVSRTSKTPTSIYLANRGYKTANVPIVPEIGVPDQILSGGNGAFVVGLVASPERIAQIRRNRVMSLADGDLKDYVDINVISSEIAFTKRLCARHRWPLIDVTRRSIEETAAAIIKLYHDRRERPLTQ